MARVGMDWPRLLAYITGTVDQELLLRNASSSEAVVVTVNLNSSYFGLAKSRSSYAFFRTSTASFFSIFSENNPLRL